MHLTGTSHYKLDDELCFISLIESIWFTCLSVKMSESSFRGIDSTKKSGLYLTYPLLFVFILLSCRYVEINILMWI